MNRSPKLVCYEKNPAIAEPRNAAALSQVRVNRSMRWSRG
jgi:hypothetical protein